MNSEFSAIRPIETARREANRIERHLYEMLHDEHHLRKNRPNKPSRIVYAADFSEIAAFLAHPWAADAIALRRWDDAAKVPGAPMAGFAEILARLP